MVFDLARRALDRPQSLGITNGLRRLPRGEDPAVVSFDATDSMTICALTGDETSAPLFRLPVQPSERNGRRAVCRLMVDKISTGPKTPAPRL